jgi:hypothetical protein
MTPRIKRNLFVFAALVLLIAAIPFISYLRWVEASMALTRQLQGQVGALDRRFTARDLDGLPAPVARYFKHVLLEGQPLVRAAVLRQEAQFRTGAGDDTWRPLRARQYFSVDPLGFVWDARIAMAPLVPVFVRDGYLHGTGFMQAKLFGVYSLVEDDGKRELNEGALQRYLAEAVWFPTALLPSDRLSWRELDDRTAIASLTDSAITVSLQFTFSESGEIKEIFTPARPRAVEGAYISTPWLVRCGAYEEHERMRIPVQCEVEWQLPHGPLPYWRGRIVDTRYAFNKASS